MSRSAADYYHGKEGYCCVQAMMAYFKYEKNIPISQELIDTVFDCSTLDLDGQCGAVYAARHIVGDELADIFDRELIDVKGSIMCDALGDGTDDTCRGVVQAAADIAEKLVF